MHTYSNDVPCRDRELFLPAYASPGVKPGRLAQGPEEKFGQDGFFAGIAISAEIFKD